MHKHVLSALIGAAFTCAISTGAFAQTTGPSSSASPYVTSTAAGWSVTSLLTVGDSVNNKPDGTPYRMVGIPDGLGAYDNKNGTFTVLMNHEIAAANGIVRAHGATGGFVSEWVIRKSDLRVLNGADLASANLVSAWGSSSWAPATGLANSFGRLCSADLADMTAFYNPLTGRGTENRIFMNGEEVGSEGRAYGFVATGSAKGAAYELPKLGKFSWENSVANPYTGDKTVVIGMDDSTPGQVYVYTGTKQYTGNDVQRAGLDNGNLRGIRVNTANAQGGASGNLEVGQINGAFSTVAVDTSVNGATQQINSRASGITEFARPEDGHWADARTFYFVTTGATTVGAQSSRLYRVTFAEAAGVIDYDNGTVSMALDSATLTGLDGAAARSFDNITVAKNGEVLIQEDPGNTSYIAKTWIFNPATGTARQIFESDRARFITGGAGFLTQDEESSGVIDITDVLGRNDGQRYFLGVMQAHYGIAGELVEGGQLYMLTQVPEPETYALMLGGLGMIAFVAIRRRQPR
jgi:hypothetical protein